MQKWEYARLVIQFEGGEYLKLTKFTPGGREQQTIESKGRFIKEKIDYWGEFDRFIVQMGLDGWELVGVTPHIGLVASGHVGGSETRAWHLGFKRPIGG